MPLVAKELIETAQAETGLDAFGGDSFREALEVLTRALEKEAELNEAGRVATRELLLRLLRNRLLIEDWYGRHPEIDEKAIEAPTFMVGLPRTGTTALAAMLARDPKSRSLRTWESGQPTPPPEAATQYDDPRIAATQAGIDAMYEAHPEWRAMYDGSATASAECQDLLGMEFRTQHFCGSYRIPSYDAWQRECDMEPAYRFQKRALKLLQWRCPPTHWHLHAPVHMLSMEALDRVYPDATFLMTHRDPADVLGSVCSLISAVRSWASDARDPEGVGEEQVGLWSLALLRLRHFRDRAGEERFADVYFTDLLGDPVETIERAYARLSLPFTHQARERIGAWAAAHPQGRHGRHAYQLADFGLDVADVRARFAFYTSRFGIEPMRAPETTP